MKGYWIAQGNVTDPDQYRFYAESAPVAFGKYNARVLARGGRCAQLEGEGRPRNVFIEFDSYEDALACYNARIPGGKSQARGRRGGRDRDRRRRLGRC